MATAIDAFFVTFGLDASGYKKGAQDIAVLNKKTAESTDSTIKDILKGQKAASDGFSKMTRAAIELFAVVAAGRSIKTLFTDAITNSADVGRTAQAVGTLTEKLSALKNMSVQAGAGPNDAASAENTVTQAIMDTARGGRNSITPLLENTAQIPLVDPQTGLVRDGSDIQLGIAHWLKGFKDQQQALSLATSVLGFSQPYSEFLLNTPDAALKAGLATQGNVSAADAAAAQQFQKSEAQLQKGFDHLANDTLPKLVPALDALTTVIGDIDAVITGKKSWASVFPNAPTVAPNPPAPDAGAAADQAFTMSYLQKKYGLTATQAAAVYGAGMNDSGGPNNTNPKSGASGFFQLLGGRLEDYKKTHGGKTPAETSLQDQLDYAMKELNSTEGAAKSILTKPGFTLNQNGGDFAMAFERPNPGNWTPSQIAKYKLNASMYAMRAAGIEPGTLPKWLTDFYDHAKSNIGVRALPTGVEADINELRKMQIVRARQTATIASHHVHIGTIHVNAPQARNARDIAGSIKQAMVDRRLVTQANGGLS